MNVWKTLSKDGSQVILNKFNKIDLPFVESAEDLDVDDFKIGCAVDVETTGLDKFRDSIIEIGIRTFYFDPTSGKILAAGKSLNQFQDPKTQLDPMVRKITGISDRDLAGKKINWQEVADILDSANLIVAHNARFDRAFIDKSVKYSEQGVWCCSLSQIDWLDYGFTSSSLTLLGAFHGYFSNAHRALQDTDLLVQILAMDSKYVKELHSNAHTPRMLITLLDTPYESRFELRRLQYRWNPQRKAWSKYILKSNLDLEVSNMREVYKGKEPKYESKDVPLSENFKD